MKKRAALVGYGAMGKNIVQLLEGHPDLELVGIIDPLSGPPCLPNLESLPEVPDVIIDFSHPANLDVYKRQFVR